MTTPPPDPDPGPPPNPIDQHLFPNGLPSSEEEFARTFELYKMMVTSSESLVSRRQGLNTFFLTANGALVTAAGLILANGKDPRLQAIAIVALTLTGLILATAWRSLVVQFGRLNTGKFAVINRIEQLFPVAIYYAEWKALGEGTQPKKYRTFTSRELWTPTTFMIAYACIAIAGILVMLGIVAFPQAPPPVQQP